MRGRKPKPTFLRLIDGNAGKRRVNKAEPIPTGDLMCPPEWLSESQRVGWQYAVDCAPAGLLRRLDRSAMTVWVVAEDIHRQAVQAVVKFGLITKTPTKGDPMQNPYLPIVNKQAQIMLKAAAELGFTPSSRSRVEVSGSATQGNKFRNNGQRGA